MVITPILRSSGGYYSKVKYTVTDWHLLVHCYLHHLLLLQFPLLVCHHCHCYLYHLNPHHCHVQDCMCCHMDLHSYEFVITMIDVK